MSSGSPTYSKFRMIGIRDKGRRGGKFFSRKGEGGSVIQVPPITSLGSNITKMAGGDFGPRGEKGHGKKGETEDRIALLDLSERKL